MLPISVHPATIGLGSLVMSLLPLQKKLQAFRGQPRVHVNYIKLCFYM